MTAQEHRILARWSGAESVPWDEHYPQRGVTRLNLFVCGKCDARVDFLILQSDVSEQEMDSALDKVRDWLMGSYGSHRLPETGELQPTIGDD
jgi:hypothetical protein